MFHLMYSINYQVVTFTYVKVRIIKSYIKEQILTSKSSYIKQLKKINKIIKKKESVMILGMYNNLNNYVRGVYLSTYTMQ